MMILTSLETIMLVIMLVILSAFAIIVCAGAVLMIVWVSEVVQDFIRYR